MNATATYIAARTARMVKYTYSRQIWYDHKLEIIRVLDSLQPDKPEDNTVGFLAYKVDGHKRMKMRTGRFLTRKLKLNNDFLPDMPIQQLATQINIKLFGDTFEIRLDKGQQITQNYKDSIGGSSCMTNDYASYTRLYESNPDRFQMLVMVSINDTARAIVHKLDNGAYHMSRVYATSEELKVRMRIYAREQGWYYKDEYTCCNGEQITDFTPLVVSGLDYEDDEIPYMDTLEGFRIEHGLLTILHTAAGDYYGTCESTCGRLEDDYICCCCDEHHSEDNIISENGEYYCSDCHSETFAYCEECDQTCLSDNVYYVDSAGVAVCERCLSENYTLCDDCNEYFANDKTYLVDDENKPICETCLENYTCCDNCGEYFSDLVYNEEENEMGYCEDCTEDRKKVIIKTTPIKDCEDQLLLSIE